MARTTSTLSGAARDKYFRELFTAEPELPAAAAGRLLKICAKEIAQLRVREPRPFRAAPQRESQPAPATAAAPTEPVAQQPSTSAPADATPDVPAFDPYAFSLVTFFRRSGRDALLARLRAVDSADNLRQLAEAQHIAIPADVTDADALREAIIDGTEQRLADRRAAAS
jgi:hypothetical protein